MRRDAEGLLERSREVGLGDAAHSRQPLDRPALVRGGVHPVLRAQQAAQQPRVLACCASVHACIVGAPLGRSHRVAVQTDAATHPWQTLRWLDERRALVRLVTAAAFAAPPLVSGEQASRIYRIAVLDDADETARKADWVEFQSRLRELGIVEGKNATSIEQANVVMMRAGRGCISGQLSACIANALPLFVALAVIGCAASGPVSLAASTATGAATPSPGTAALPAPPEGSSGYRTGMTTSYAARHMAAAANPHAAEAGREMLRRGGAAIDAAVAMQAVLTLVEPQATGIGGGAFVMLWDGKAVHAYDGRETAPMGATEALFLQPDGTPDALQRCLDRRPLGGIPGVMRMLELAHRDHGRLPWKLLFDPAIRLAEQGFPMSARLHMEIAADRFLPQSPAMAAYFLNPDKSPKPVGTLLKNPALAAVLRRIADEGVSALYEGVIAQEIVAQVNGSANPGSMALSDLKAYVAKERAPICSDYRRFRVCGVPPPSSGGIAIAQILGILQALDRRAGIAPLASLKPLAAPNAAGIEAQPEAVHRIAEADRLAYADRGLYVADSDFIPVPVAGLIDPAYLAGRATLIGERSMGKAEPGTPAGAPIALAPDRSPLRLSTSQIVAVDDFGGAVSMTTTVESYFGSHLMVQGFMLNNELTDFSFVPSEAGKPVANRVQPGKRPLSSMAPTLVFDRASGALVAALGSPGGTQIIEYVAKAVVGLLDWEMDPQAAVNLPNFGSRNGVTEVEKGLASPGLVQALKDRGHAVRELEMTSGVQAIVRVEDANGRPRWAGAADPRREGAALGD